MIQIIENANVDREALISLYNALHWSNYTRNPSSLLKAVSQSLYTAFAYNNDELVGLIRVVGDDESIAYIQDILIKPEYQQQGIGSMLLDRVKKRFFHVRQMVLMSDIESHNGLFYHKHGFVKGSNYGLEMFVIIK